MKHSVFLICRNVPNYSSYLTTKDTDFSKKNIEYWSLDRENATEFFSKQAAEEHIELYAQKLLEYKAKIIHDSELFSLEAKRKKYIEAFYKSCDAIFYYGKRGLKLVIIQDSKTKKIIEVLKEEEFDKCYKRDYEWKNI